MSSCFVGYLLKVETFCCCKCVYFREQIECFKNFVLYMWALRCQSCDYIVNCITVQATITDSTFINIYCYSGVLSHFT